MTLSLVPVTKALQTVPFDCSNPILNDYFRFYALKNDRLSIGKTFVAITDEKDVAGYMTLSGAQIEANSLPEEIRAILPRYPIFAFRIAKLAVDSRHHGSGVGGWLLRSAFEKAIAVSDSIGMNIVLVDAIDEKARGFYLKYGFTPFAEHPMTLFLPLATIKAALARESRARSAST